MHYDNNTLGGKWTARITYILPACLLKFLSCLSHDPILEVSDNNTVCDY